MLRVFSRVFIAAACMVLAVAANANRLIVIPTGDNLTGIKAEYQQRFDGDGTIYWVNAGISRVEIEGARFQDFGGQEADSFSAQVSILPETSFTPALSVGARDIGDSTAHKGMPYDGRSFYLVATKGIPITGGIPLLFQDVRLTGGLGTGSLSGVFLGIEGKLPMGLRVATEYDSKRFNAMLSYTIIPKVRLDIGMIKSDLYYGAKFSTGF